MKRGESKAKGLKRGSRIRSVPTKAKTRHPGADWWKEAEERNRAIAEATRERAAPQAAEREQRFKEQQEHERAADEQRRIELHRATGWPV